MSAPSILSLPFWLRPGAQAGDLLGLLAFLLSGSRLHLFQLVLQIGDLLVGAGLKIIEFAVGRESPDAEADGGQRQDSRGDLPRQARVLFCPRVPPHEARDPACPVVASRNRQAELRPWQRGSGSWAARVRAGWAWTCRPPRSQSVPVSRLVLGVDRSRAERPDPHRSSTKGGHPEGVSGAGLARSGHHGKTDSRRVREPGVCGIDQRAAALWWR